MGGAIFRVLTGFTAARTVSGLLPQPVNNTNRAALRKIDRYKRECS
jgi:hypothetical protein